MTTTYIMSANKSDFTTTYSPTIKLDPSKKYEAALLSLDMYNSIPNITKDNNIFTYSVDNGVTWKIIALDTGSYELGAINNEIQRLMVINGDYNNNLFYITITANVSKLTSIVNITNPTYKVDFGVENSIGSVLGFEALIIGAGYNESPNIVDIMKINSILVNTDIIMGSYVNNYASPAIYSFYPNVSPGYKIVERPNPSLIFYPVARSDIRSIRVWLTDQDSNPVDLRGEIVTVRICIREVKSRSIRREIIAAYKDLKKQNII